MRLDELPLNRSATITSIDWSVLAPSEARRLQELGFDEGVVVETLHAGGMIGKDPIACRVGRMTVAIRRNHAFAISVSTAA